MEQYWQHLKCRLPELRSVGSGVDFERHAQHAFPQENNDGSGVRYRLTGFRTLRLPDDVSGKLPSDMGLDYRLGYDWTWSHADHERAPPMLVLDSPVNE